MKVVLKYRYVHTCQDRHGNVRVYFRRRAGAPKVRLKEAPGTPAFDLEYQHALASSDEVAKSNHIKPGNVRWLLESYLRSSAYASLSSVTRRRRATMLKQALCERWLAGSKFDFGDCPVVKFQACYIEILVERKVLSGGPYSGDNLLKAFRGLTKWAFQFSHLEEDLAAQVKRVKASSDGYRTWTESEVEAFRQHYPLGTVARAVLEIGVNTGLRRSDIARLGPQHIVDGVIRLTAAKNKAKLAVPVVPELQAALDALPRRDLAFVVTQYDDPYTPVGLSNWFRQRCDAIGLEGLSLHGLRAFFATRVAESGGTELELMALGGWRGAHEVRRYTRQANVERLARAGIEKLLGSAKASPPQRTSIPAARENLYT